MKVYLEYKDAKSDKFWKIHQQGPTLTVTYGRIGSAGQTKTKELASEDKAIGEAEKLITQKRKKGYKDAGEPVAAPSEKKLDEKLEKKPVKTRAGSKTKKTKRPADRTIKSFFKAIGEGAVDKVKKAVDGSMPASIRFCPWDRDQGDERTALIHALWSNQPDVARILLEAGAAVTDADDGGSTALHHVTDADICGRLIAAGADVHACTDRGQTPLHTAASQQAVEVVRQLITAGADVNATDNDGITPHIDTTSVSIRDQLIEAGAAPLPNPGGEPLTMPAKTVTLADIDADRGAIGIGGDGALWVGSYSGLFRFDGDSVIHYDSTGDSGGSPAIDTIVGGADGSTYFGTNWGLIRAKDGAFTLYNNRNSPLHDPHLVYTAIDARGRVHCVGYESEAESKHISVFDGERWSMLRPDGDDLPEEMELECIHFTDAGQMLIGTGDGLYTKRAGAWSLDTLDDNTFSPTIYDIALVGDALWLGTQRGVYRRVGDALSLTKTEHLAKVLCRDGDVMWVGTGYGGIYKFDLASGEMLGHLRAENNLKSMVRGGDGTVWVQAGGNLYALRDEALDPISQRSDDVGADHNSGAEQADEPMAMLEKPLLDPRHIPAEIAAEVEKAALSGISAQQLLSLIRPAIGFALVSGEVPVGASKFGGTPDLPSNLEWPRYQDEDDALPFLLQLNLEQSAPLDLESLLPERGMLYVFTDTRPDELVSWKIISTEAPVSELSRAELPESLVDRRGVDDFVAEFPEHRLTLRGQLTLPSSEFIGERCKLSEGDEEAIDALQHRLSELDGGALPNQFLGWPDNVQGEFLTDENDIVLLQLSGYQLTGEGIEGIEKYFEHWCADGLLHWVGYRSDIVAGNFDHLGGLMAYA